MQMTSYPVMSKRLDSPVSHGRVAMIRSGFGSPRLPSSDGRLVVWHRELTKLDRRLPLIKAAKRLSLVCLILGACALYFSSSRLNSTMGASQAASQLFLLIGSVSFPLTSIFALYAKQRKAFLSRNIYVAGYRMKDSGELVSNEPNPEILPASADKPHG